MKIYKLILSLLLAFSLSISATGCGSNASSVSAKTNDGGGSDNPDEFTIRIGVNSLDNNFLLKILDNHTDFLKDKGITLEGYLGAVNETEVSIDYGKSVLYTKAELDEVFTRIKCQFASWEGVELHALRYAGDTCNNDANLVWINSLSEGANYSRIIEVFSDFHTSKEGYGTLEPDQHYSDFQWWLACGEDGDWDIVSFGY